MKRWEYALVTVPYREMGNAMTKDLSDMGWEGWKIFKMSEGENVDVFLRRRVSKRTVRLAIKKARRSGL